MKRKVIFNLVIFLYVILASNAFGTVWPISGNNQQDVLTSAFGPRTINGSWQMHEGLDCRAQEAVDVLMDQEGVPLYGTTS